MDAVVIGAGHQGLVAAVVLAEAGLQVAVVEGSPDIGGATRSGDPVGRGHVHDLFATNMNLFLGSPFFARHGAEMTRLGLEFAHSGVPYASAFAGRPSLRVSSDEAGTLEMFRRHSARDAQGWSELRKVFDDLATAYQPVYTHPQPSRSALSAARSLWRSRRSTPPGALAKILLSSTRALGLRYFETEEARSLVAAWGMHLDYGPDLTGGAVFPVLECFGDMLAGMNLVRGGAGRLPATLAAMLRARGGQILTGSAVTGISLRAGRAVAVSLADGRTLPARRGVLSTAVLPRLVGLLPEGGVPSAMARAAVDYRFGPGTLMTHLVLAGPVPWSDPALADCAYVHLAGGVDDMARTYQQALAGLLPDRPTIVVGQTSTVDPSRSADGREAVVWVQVRTVPGSIRGDSLGRITDIHWAAAAQPFTDRVLDLIELHAPGFRESILGRHTLSPAELERGNPNLVGGDSVAGSHHLDQFLALRPSWSLSRYRTEVPGLYLAGSGTWPGAGVNAVSGELAAWTLLRSSRIRRG